MLIYINGRFLTQQTTGVQRVAYEISSRLIQRGNGFIFLCPKKTLNFDTKEFNIIKFGWFSGQLWEQIDLPIYLWKRKYRAVVNFCNSAPILCSKKIITIHDMAIKRGKEWYSLKFRLWYNLMFFFNIRPNNIIITDSFFSKKEILSYFPKVMPKVIYLGGFVIKNHFAIKNENVFLAVSSVEPRKNIQTILEAFRLLENTDIELNLIGGKSSVFKSLNISVPKNVKLLGRVSDEELKYYYQQSNAFISASLYEGFGLPILESQSYGLPCIISDISVYRELFRESAIYFNPLSAEELAQRIMALYSDKSIENHYIQLSLLNKEQFSWDKSADEYFEVISQYNS